MTFPAYAVRTFHRDSGLGVLGSTLRFAILQVLSRLAVFVLGCVMYVERGLPPISPKINGGLFHEGAVPFRRWHAYEWNPGAASKARSD